MRKIHLLPPHIIAKIAAGEVIERPAYAVKELIENALDAKADAITVVIEESGLKKIVVTDTGEGMSRDDLLESFKPHTTSKISEDHPLVGIASFGFRGEALSSIAAVSTITIQSRQKNQAGGHAVTIQEGKLVASEPVGMPYGTSVTIKNLFASLPARKKFLKSRHTEFRHILDVVTHYAIAFPDIRFFVSHNKRIMLDVPAKQKRADRLHTVLGSTAMQQFFPLFYEDSYITLSGFLARPTLTTQSLQKQFLFVNNRAVSDKAISVAVKESYGSMLDPTSHPLFVLFVTVPHEFVDVNIHPRKEQISFVNNSFLFDAIKKAVLETLSKENISFANVSWKEDHVLQKGVLKGIGSTKSFAGKLLKNMGIPTTLGGLDKKQILQIHNVYLLLQTKNGFVMIDQHAAHERVLYEEFSKAFKEQKNKQYTLKKPIALELSLTDNEIIQEYQTSFTALGFVLINGHSGKSRRDASRINSKSSRKVDSGPSARMTETKNTVWQISAVPYLLKDRDIQTVINELLDDLLDNKTIKDIDMQSHRMLAYLACRAAVKAGDALSQKQSKQLLEDLEKTENNLTCPHGRPTRIEVNIKELHTLFRR